MSHVVDKEVTKVSLLYSHTDLLLVCFVTLIHHHCEYVIKYDTNTSVAKSCPNVQVTQESDMLGIVLAGIPSAYITYLATCKDILLALKSMLRWVDGHFNVEDMIVGIWVPCKLVS